MFIGEDGFQYIRVPTVREAVVKGDEVTLPKYKSAEAVCCDIYAQIPTDEAGNRHILLTHRTGAKVRTGLRVAIPLGWKLCFAARSSFADRGLIVTNAPAQIDSDHRGEMSVVVLNVGREIIEIKHGDRIAQCWIEPAIRVFWDETDILPETERGDGGFGSTGVTN